MLIFLAVGEILVSAQGPLVLGFCVWGFGVWGLGLTKFSPALANKWYFSFLNWKIKSNKAHLSNSAPLTPVSTTDGDRMLTLPQITPQPCQTPARKTITVPCQQQKPTSTQKLCSLWQIINWHPMETWFLITHLTSSIFSLSIKSWILTESWYKAVINKSADSFPRGWWKAPPS